MQQQVNRKMVQLSFMGKFCHHHLAFSGYMVFSRQLQTLKKTRLNHDDVSDLQISALERGPSSRLVPHALKAGSPLDTCSGSVRNLSKYIELCNSNKICKQSIYIMSHWHYVGRHMCWTFGKNRVQFYTLFQPPICNTYRMTYIWYRVPFWTETRSQTIGMTGAPVCLHSFGVYHISLDLTCK